jgi:hypothetical protein
MTKLIVDGKEIDIALGGMRLRARASRVARSCCLAGAIGWLVALGAATAADLPANLVGSWSKQAGAVTANPRFVILAAERAAIDGEQCRLDSLRAIHASRWYADMTCGLPDVPSRVWLDINLLAQNRMMLNRRPLAEADIYIRETSQE